VISHEVRQPIHNAQRCFKGWRARLRSELAESDAAGGRVERARAVAAQITASLRQHPRRIDACSSARSRAPLRDTDVDMLLELSLGDLPAAGRRGCAFVRDSEVRTAAMVSA